MFRTDKLFTFEKKNPHVALVLDEQIGDGPALADFFDDQRLFGQGFVGQVVFDPTV